MRVDPDEIIDDVLVRRGRRRFPIPWGLFILLGLYFGGVWGFLRYEYYNAPEFKSARHLRIAGQMLGEDNGMTAESANLLEALDHLLAALSAYPDDPLAPLHSSHQLQIFQQLQKQLLNLLVFHLLCNLFA